MKGIRLRRCFTCRAATSGGKPYCSEHIGEMPEVKDLTRKVELDATPNPESPLWGDIILELQKGQKSVYGLYKILGITATTGEKYLSKMSKLLKVSVVHMKRGSKRIVELK